MPHCIVEYTDNLIEDGAIPELLEKLAAKFRDSGGVFPVGGLRVRAIRLTEYVLADGKGDDAFVNVTAKIGPGRPLEFRKTFFGEMFEILKDHFAEIWTSRGLALSLYVEENDEDGSFKINNIHHRLKASA
jgi:5-carboxymethyl-2-hydroxymuconate isomerase